MSHYFFRLSHDRFSGVADCPIEALDHDAAWAEITKASSNLVAGICRKLKPQSDWRMELLDELGKPRFRIRLVAEELDH